MMPLALRRLWFRLYRPGVPLTIDLWTDQELLDWLDDHPCPICHTAGPCDCRDDR